MTNDIVVRLRCDAGEFFMRYGDTLLTEAADEIERLYAELNDATLEQAWAERNAAVAELHNYKETSQAREEKLREALEHYMENASYGQGAVAYRALALPTNGTALKGVIERTRHEAYNNVLVEWHKPWGLSDGKPFIKRLEEMAGSSDKITQDELFKEMLAAASTPEFDDLVRKRIAEENKRFEAEEREQRMLWLANKDKPYCI